MEIKNYHGDCMSEHCPVAESLAHENTALRADNARLTEELAALREKVIDIDAGSTCHPEWSDCEDAARCKTCGMLDCLCDFGISP